MLWAYSKITILGSRKYFFFIIEKAFAKTFQCSRESQFDYKNISFILSAKKTKKVRFFWK